MSKVVIIGAGAAGMMAAYSAALCGHQVVLLEKNEKPGKKLFITGKGRCNITNASDPETMFASFIRNRKFMYSSFYTFDNQAVLDFFESNGLPVKIERGNRVFPVSDHSSDVIKTLQKVLREYNVEIHYLTTATELMLEAGVVKGVKAISNKKQTVFLADSVICTCGGCSYPVTGSSGDGYKLAKQAGHSITELKPSLVPLVAREDYIKELQGLSLKNVKATLHAGNKKVFEEFGEMLFTHFGVSGPLILSASSVANDWLGKQELSLTIDLKPALSLEQLDLRLQRDFSENINKAFKNAVSGLLPSKLIPVIIRLSGIDEDRKVHSITREERLHLVELLKAFPCTVVGYRGYEEAIITRGGITVKEINPSTMESKLVKNLYFAGEVLDLDALTGGFNLQIAWSTGYVAGISVEHS